METYTTAGIICIDKDTKKFLVMQSRFNDKKWSFPKGYISKNETPLAAAIRELHEETEIELSEDDLLEYTQDLHLKLNKPTKKIPSGIKIIKFFVAYVDEKTPIKLSREHSKYKWISEFNEVPLQSEFMILGEKIKCDLC